MSLCNSVNVINHEWQRRARLPCGEGGEDKNNMVRSNKGCHLVYHTARKTSKHCGFHTGNALSLHMKYGTTQILQYVFFFACRKNEAFYHMEISIKNYRDKPKDFGAAPLPPEKKKRVSFCGSLEKLQCERGCFSDLHLSRSRRQGFITFVQSTTLHNCKL